MCCSGLDVHRYFNGCVLCVKSAGVLLPVVWPPERPTRAAQCFGRHPGPRSVPLAGLQQRARVSGTSSMQVPCFLPLSHSLLNRELSSFNAQVLFCFFVLFQTGEWTWSGCSVHIWRNGKPNPRGEREMPDSGTDTCYLVQPFLPVNKNHYLHRIFIF